MADDTPESERRRSITIDGKAAGYLVAGLLGLASGGGIGTLASQDKTAEKIDATSQKVTDLISQVQNLRTELASELKYQSQQDAALDRGLKEVRVELRAHTRLPWHREAGAEHSETKRRVTRLEQEIDDLRDQVRGKKRGDK